MFEEAIAIANLMLQGGQEIAQTVRTATFVDNTWKVMSCLCTCVYHLHWLQLQPCKVEGTQVQQYCNTSLSDCTCIPLHGEAFASGISTEQEKELLQASASQHTLALLISHSS